MTLVQFNELAELAGNLHTEAGRCRDCGRWAAALFFLGGSAEAALLANVGVSEPELRAAGLWNPPKGDPTKWTLGNLGNLARNAGWLPTQSPPAAEPTSRQRPAQSVEDDIFTSLDGETGDALRFVERIRNMIAHPGAYVREPLRPDTANDEHMRQTYELIDGILADVFDRLTTQMQTLPG
ncbi:MAG: hypothetical protein ACYCS7_15545 [Acidimicrobiales bacterium]